MHPRVPTFCIQLHVDDIPHNGGVVQVLDGFPGAFDGGKDDFGDAQVLPVLGVVQNLHFFHLAVFFAHVSQEVFTDVVVQLGKSDLLGGHGPHIKLINLGVYFTGGGREEEEEAGPITWGRGGRGEEEEGEKKVTGVRSVSGLVGKMKV